MIIKSLTKLTSQLYELPPSSQRVENICSMSNFSTEAARLMDRLEISRIVEIGCEAGFNTDALLDYVRKRKCLLDSVDPVEVNFPFSTETASEFTFHQEISGLFLNREMNYEVLFMDGDHNYETVFADLNVIHQKRHVSGIKLIFMHDVCWPWARRDIYYNIRQIRCPHPHAADIRISPYNEPIYGQGLPPSGYSTANEEGGAQNGVLTAVEDFLKLHQSEWQVKTFPVIYGIGVLYCPENLTSFELKAITQDLNELERHKILLSTLELNRIENLCRIEQLRYEIQHAGDVWRSDQEYIKTINLLLTERTLRIGALNKTILAQKQQIAAKNNAFEKSTKAKSDFEQALLHESEARKEIAGQLQMSREENRLQKEHIEKIQNVIDTLKHEYEECLAECSELKSIVQLQEEDLRQMQHAESKHCSDLARKSQLIAEIQNTLWTRDQQIRRMELSRCDMSWRFGNLKAVKLLSYSLRNRIRLRHAETMIAGGEVKLLSLDVFDTLLFRETKSELRRFWEIVYAMHEEFPSVTVLDFYHARTVAHRLAYQTQMPISGCRETTLENIHRILGRIVNLNGQAEIESLKNIELNYEKTHLRLNPGIWHLVETAATHHVRIIAVSDMYLNSSEIEKILSALLPDAALINKIYSSCDSGVSKASGILWDQVIASEQVAPEQMLHLGDNYHADFEMPFIRNGIFTLFCPRSVLYSRIVAKEQSYFTKQLLKQEIIHGIR